MRQPPPSQGGQRYRLCTKKCEPWLVEVYYLPRLDQIDVNIYNKETKEEHWLLLGVPQLNIEASSVSLDRHNPQLKTFLDWLKSHPVVRFTILSQI